MSFSLLEHKEKNFADKNECLNVKMWWVNRFDNIYKKKEIDLIIEC